MSETSDAYRRLFTRLIRFPERLADVVIDWRKQEHAKAKANGEDVGRAPRRRQADGLVLTPANDPYWVAHNNGHVLGQWLADALTNLGIGQLHFRGIHYKLIGYPKPDGTPYANTDKDWTWLQAGPGKAARWLGYITFDRIIDERNASPTLILRPIPEPEADVSNGDEVFLPSADEMMPSVTVTDFDARQGYRLVLVGEKSSLGAVMRPLSEEFGTDLLLPTGELSDTMIYRMVNMARQDGRPTIALYVSDCDPAGWQMSISLSRKVQALRDSLFPSLNMTIYRVALTPEQVLDNGLPSTPLKEGEARAEKWVDAMGVEQTEVDAVDPAMLEDWLREAISPFFDDTLAERIEQAEAEWLAEAQEAIDDALGEKWLATHRERVEKRLAAIRKQADALNEAARRALEAANYTLPDIEPPEPEYNDYEIEALGDPLYTTDWQYGEGTLNLQASKAYDEDD